MPIDRRKAGVLKRHIKAHVAAQVDLSWKGSKMPDEAEDIEAEAARLESKLMDFIESLCEPKTDPSVLPEYER